MPLGIRLGDSSNSRLCGMETNFIHGMPEIIKLTLNVGQFDFVVVPLMDASYRPSIAAKRYGKTPLAELLPVSASDFNVTPSDWNEHVVGKISTWIDLDSNDEALRLDSETALKQETSWASYLCLQACILPTPKGTSWANYARCVNQILQGLKDMHLWLRIPLGKSDGDSSAISSTSVDPWEMWNSFRQLSEHHTKLQIAFDILNILPSDNSLKRWVGEPVSAAIIPIDVFLTKAEGDDIGKYLPERHQTLVTSFFDHSVQIIISGRQGQPNAGFNPLSAIDPGTYPLRHYLEHLRYLYIRLGPLPEKERLEFGLRDVVKSHLQPLTKNLNSQNYENLERDSEKYAQYRRAICQALLERVPDEKASETTTVLMVVGAGRGALVLKSLQAAKDAERKLKVYAVEKNPDAIVALKESIKSENYTDLVTIISSDIRYWDAPETADILVSELLGSFGDNELSPECIDGAERLLKEDGISIPSSYTSFLQPVTASKLFANVSKHKDDSNFEAAYFAKIHDVAQLAPSQPVFTFTHPDLDNESNNRYKKLSFEMPRNTGSAIVHGFVGYFDAILYKDVHIGTEPSMAIPNLISWFPMFFPLRTPVCVDRGNLLVVHFWRCSDSTKVWYEWCVTSPSVSPIHNINGSSCCVEL